MRDKLLNLWQSFRANLWFIPLSMGLLGILLAVASLHIDRQIPEDPVEGLEWLYTTSTEGARLLLSSIVGSVMTVLAMIFSVTVVTLTLASSQYGHRLLRHFISDVANQFVMGTFICTFIFSLLILRSVRGYEGETSFIPQIAMNLAIVLSILSLGVLIYFIHHIATSIQVDRLVFRVSQELEDAIRRMFPKISSSGSYLESGGQIHITVDDKRLEELFSNAVFPIHTRKEVYLQSIDYDELIHLAQRHHLIIRLRFRPGDFIYQENILAEITSDGTSKESNWKDISKNINTAFSIGMQRNMTQDILFGMDLISEIAIRAMSPSINAPFTAISCIHRLGSALSTIAHRQMPSRYLLDEEGALRVIVLPLEFKQVIDAAFNQIRYFSYKVPVIALTLLDTLEQIAEHATHPEIRSNLLRHAQMIERGAREHISEENDLREIRKCYDDVLMTLHSNYNND